MKQFLRSKKAIVPLATMVATVVAALGAFADYSGPGAGLVTATAGAAYDPNTVQLSSDDIRGRLYPGGDPVNVTVHVHNPNPGAAFVDQITGSVANGGDCLGSWFTVAPIDYATNVAKHADGADAATTVTFNDNGGNQNACQDATLTIHWRST
jgi:hypothetical protein